MGTGELLRARRAGLAEGVCLTTGVLEVLLVCPGNPAQLVLGMGTAPHGFSIMFLGYSGAGSCVGPWGLPLRSSQCGVARAWQCGSGDFNTIKA